MLFKSAFLKSYFLKDLKDQNGGDSIHTVRSEYFTTDTQVLFSIQSALTLTIKQKTGPFI